MQVSGWVKLGGTAGALGAVLAAAAGGTYAAVVRRPLPRRTGRRRLPGLQADVEVIVDTWGVPHIYAQSASDVVRAQGYLHAQDRLWQMEFTRRVVSGRLSELVGEVALPLDRWMRTLSLRHTAEAEPPLLSEEARRLLEAYAAGVNTRIDEGRLPLEFSLLRHRPEPWTPVDSLAWVKMMALTLSTNWEAEIVRARILDRIGPALAAELEPPYAAGMPLIVPEGVDYSCIGGQALARSAAAEAISGPVAMDGLGSNNWVVHGSRTDTGMPLLANDMHLGLTIPAVWYENHLVSPDLEVTGVSFPGIPAVVSGHSTAVAWGFTNGFPDVQDLYVEHLRTADDGTVEAEFAGGWEPVAVRREQIAVKGGAPVTEQVMTTRHGPVINGLSPEHAGEQPLALRWTAYEPNAMIDTLLAMSRARSCAQMREALRGWHTPVQNVVYADIHGDIGYSYAGRVPIRAAGDGRTPVPGWTGEYEWIGVIPYEDLPHQENPPTGYLATANNRVVDDGYPYWLGTDFVTGNRAQRIREMLEQADVVDTATIRRMHLDVVSPSARRMAGIVSRVVSGDPVVDEALRLMAGWDGTLGADSPQAAVYQVFGLTLARRLLRPRLGDLTDLYTGKGITPVVAETSLMGEHCREWLDAVLDEPGSHWWDTGGGESREQQIVAAMRDTVAELSSRFGADPVRWRWGAMHMLHLRHPLGSRPPLDRLLNRGPFPMGGDADTLWNSMVARHDVVGDGVMIGPPFRFIADLADLGQSRGQLMPGQSGQLGSPHYSDGIGPWLRGDYHPMLLDRAAVEGNAEARFTLVP